MSIGNTLRRCAMALLGMLSLCALNAGGTPPDLADRPAQLLRAMDPGPLRERLHGCLGVPQNRHPFSVAHRGAPLGFPEHTVESYRAAAAQGAGRIECDASPTRDGVLVCRHSQCDLHSTTDILQTALAARCRKPFAPADSAKGQIAGAQCCVSDLSLVEFRQLKGRHDRVDPTATTLGGYLAPGGEDRGTLLTHAESIRLLDSLGTDMIPELKQPDPGLAFPPGFDGQEPARRLIQEYIDAGIEPDRVTAQSFNRDDLRFWLERFPAFGARAAWLDARVRDLPGFDHRKPSTWKPTMAELKAAGIRVLAPPMPALLDLEEGRIVASAYARAAQAAGFRVIAWTTERSGPLDGGGGFFYVSVREAIRGDGDLYPVIDVLAREAKVDGLFSDWPATTTFYANCMLPLRSPGAAPPD